MSIVLWLAEIGPQHSDQVGTKALNLAEIRQAGFGVPDGFCITTTAYQEFVAANGLEPAIHSLLAVPAAQMQGAALHLQEAIRAGQTSAEMHEAICKAHQALAMDAWTTKLPVAVRSSATAEDLPTASFAGQHATLLNVRDEQQLLRAMVECWASLWSPHAVLYRVQQGHAQRRPVIAVLVQLMVDSEAAGVAFSLDPVSGEEKALIEAAWGLGETVVSGGGSVDRYAVERQTFAEIGPPSIGHKPHKRVMAAQGGVQTAEVAAEMQDSRVLTPQEVRQVAEAVVNLERHFGTAQDMEWAFADGQLHILQSRPTTSSARSFFTDVLTGDDQIWTSGFLNERFSLPVSPLGWSVIQELVEELAFRDPLRYLGLRGVEQLRLTRLYRGHPYVSVFVFQTLYKVFPDSLLPEDAYRYFPAGKTELRRSVAYPRSPIDPRFLLSMVRHFLRQPRVWSPWHSYQAWEAFELRHEERNQQLQADLRALRKEDGTVGRIWAAIHEAQQLNVELLALHRWSLTLAGLTYTLLRRLVRSWGKDEDAEYLCACLVTGLPNKSVEMDRALLELAHTKDTAAFAEALRSFLIRYGHRSFHLDIYYPSFADAPDQVRDLVEQLRHAANRPDAHRAAACEQAQATVRKLLGGRPMGWLKRAVFDHVLYLTQQYMSLREEQRFYWQQTLAIMREFFLLLGTNMAQARVLENQEQVFFLTKAEIEAYALGRVSGEQYAAVASARQQQFTRLQHEFQAAPAWAYPPFLRGNQPLEMPQHEHDMQFQGRGVSPGLARGRVVVLFSPAEFGKVKEGDVLVTRSIDPGWTPIFSLLRALVVEHGGQLSHGAVVAREYRLPAVSGIARITQLVRDGDMVVVDGLTGVVLKISSD